jgi:hypothetical protein
VRDGAAGQAGGGRWLKAIRASNCLATCDPDCEVGDVHCWFVHLPSHKPGWHTAENCPFADVLRGQDGDNDG